MESMMSPQEEEETADRSGGGRCYECVFCKRGFTTAQALGGHMNIHRKDKANNNKNKPTFVIPSSTKLDSDHPLAFYYFSSSTIPTGGNNNNHYYEVDSSSSSSSSSNHHHNLQGYFPPPKERNLSFYNHNNFSNSSSSSSCFGEVKDKVQVVDDNSDEGGSTLDLELRLGHHHHP